MRPVHIIFFHQNCVLNYFSWTISQYKINLETVKENWIAKAKLPNTRHYNTVLQHLKVIFDMVHLQTLVLEGRQNYASQIVPCWSNLYSFFSWSHQLTSGDIFKKVYLEFLTPVHLRWSKFRRIYKGTGVNIVQKMPSVRDFHSGNKNV